jgi:predicted RNase H-like HicB family nuclease
VRQVLVYHGESGLWVAEVPSLPGSISQGETREEAVENIREAIDLHIEALRDHNQNVPADTLGALLVRV